MIFSANNLAVTHIEKCGDGIKVCSSDGAGCMVIAYMRGEPEDWDILFKNITLASRVTWEVK